MRRVCLSAITLVAAACGSSSTGPHAIANIVFIGDNQTDTVFGTPTRPLMVRVRIPEGQQATGHVVQFQALPDTNASLGYQVYFLPGNTPSWVDSTNSSAEASVIVEMGAQAGTARLVVTVPDFGYVDTAKFTVTAGSAYSVQASPVDTFVVPGASFTYKAWTADRYGNRRNDSLTYTVGVGSPATMSGATVTATAPGFAYITIAAPKPGLGLYTTVTVVPRGTLATANGQVITVFNTDGSNMHTITPAAPPGMIKWDPTGAHLVFARNTPCSALPGQEIYTTDLTGATKTVDSSVTYDEYATYSRDGTWIYYSRNTGGSSAIWRVHPDGTSDDSLATTMPLFDIYPSPSPDGSRIAYVADHGGDSTDLRILVVSTGSVTSYGVNAWSPAWAPSGNQIAFISFLNTVVCAGPLQLINADGTGLRAVASDTSYFAGIDWSPDGQWIVATNATNNIVELINATTGLTIPLPFAAGQYSPTWQPLQPSTARFRHAVASGRPLPLGRVQRAGGVPR